MIRSRTLTTLRPHLLVARRARGALWAVSSAWLLGCASAPPAAPVSASRLAETGSAAGGESAAEAPAEVAEPAAAAPPAPSVPEACANTGADCLPPASWVNALCNGVYAEVALVMFRGGTPWQRRYLLGKTRAVNASGGETVEGSLSRDEEVIVLRHRKADTSGLQIGDGSGQYDALRWNGSCVSLEAGEVTTRRPRAPGQAHIEWSWLGDGMRSALRSEAAINELFLARKKECRGATTGSVSLACERLDQKLVARIAEHVRSGPELPAPEQHP